MSAIKVEAYSGDVQVVTAEDMRALLGDRLEGVETFQNSDMVSTGTSQLPFDYVATFQATDIMIGTADVSLTGLRVFADYPSVIGGSYLVYACHIPDEIIAQFPIGYSIQCSIQLNLSFSNVKYFQFGCGFAHDYNRYRNLNPNKYPNNYLYYNGVAVQSPFYTNQNMYCDVGAKVVPDDFNDEENLFPYPSLYFTQNVISYSEEDASSFSIDYCVSQGTHVYNRAIYFMILCPVSNADSESENVSGPVTKKDIHKISQDIQDLIHTNEIQVTIINNTYNEIQDTNNLLDRIIALLTGLIDALNAGQLAELNATALRIEALLSGGLGGGGSGGLSKSDVVDLFALDKEDMAEIQTDWNHMFKQYFPALYDAHDVEAEFMEDLISSDLSASQSVHYDGFSVGSQQIIEPMDIPFRPAGSGWDVLFDTLKIAVNCVFTFMFINGLRYRFDKSVLEDAA